MAAWRMTVSQEYVSVIRVLYQVFILVKLPVLALAASVRPVVVLIGSLATYFQLLSSCCSYWSKAVSPEATVLLKGE